MWMLACMHNVLFFIFKFYFAFMVSYTSMNNSSKSFNLPQNCRIMTILSEQNFNTTQCQYDDVCSWVPVSDPRHPAPWRKPIRQLPKSCRWLKKFWQWRRMWASIPSFADIFFGKFICGYINIIMLTLCMAQKCTKTAAHVWLGPSFNLLIYRKAIFMIVDVCFLSLFIFSIPSLYLFMCLCIGWNKYPHN